eukprot:gnl/Trimastix_PCT/765.p1 GENE.gnl/Trimastix_PCT/765~~gnl/Trimastix_PCT/765.p1  ORF type:complete len:295 (+),score=52.68 gnl/Trimastix_PCT/765:45-929(+)
MLSDSDTADLGVQARLEKSSAFLSAMARMIPANLFSLNSLSNSGPGEEEAHTPKIQALGTRSHLGLSELRKKAEEKIQRSRRASLGADASQDARQQQAERKAAARRADKEKRRAVRSREKGRRTMAKTDFSFQGLDRKRAAPEPAGGDISDHDDAHTSKRPREDESMIVNPITIAPRQAMLNARPKKDMTAMLKQAEKKQRAKARMSQTDEGKAELESQAWDRLEQMAMGTKLKDDPRLLKKTMKRKQNLKKKHAKQWAERLKVVRQDKAERQRKRAENIQERKNMRKGKGKRR